MSGTSIIAGTFRAACGKQVAGIESVIKINLEEVKISSPSSTNIVLFLSWSSSLFAQRFEMDTTKISQKLYLLEKK